MEIVTENNQIVSEIVLIMNILFCYRNWMNPNNGGVQRVSDTMAKYFVRKGHKVYYLNFERKENDNYIFPAEIYLLPDNNFFSGVNINYYHNLLHELSIDIVINHDSSNDRSKFWLNTGQLSVKKISLYHTDPLHGIHDLPNLSGIIKKQLLRKVILINLNGIIHYLKIARKKSEISRLLKKSDRLVFLSAEFIHEIYKELGIRSSKIEAINNPCVTYEIEGVQNKKKQILFVARIDLPVKRPDKMLQIWSRLENKFPDWELLFLGDGSDRNKVEEMSKDLGLKNVKFEGFVDPIPYYKVASVICMTSEYEGFGLVLPEAMQFGVVPITFNNWVSLKDIITDQVTGILVSTDNITEYSEQLEQLLSDEVVRNRISNNVKEYAKKFEIESIGPRWTKLFDGLFNGNIQG